MQGVEKLSIALTAEQAAMVREAVRTGEYATAGEVIREALRLWEADRQAKARELEELRRLWQEGIESGPALDGRAAFARLRQRIGREGDGLRVGREHPHPGPLPRWRAGAGVGSPLPPQVGEG